MQTIPGGMHPLVTSVYTRSESMSRPVRAYSQAALRLAITGRLKNKGVPSMSKMTYSIFGLDIFTACAMMF